MENEIEIPVVPSFFDRPGVKTSIIPLSGGIPLGIETAANPQLGIGGAYGTWGQCFDNKSLPSFVTGRMSTPLADEEVMNLTDLGFLYRHHLPELSDEDHLELETEVGARLLSSAIDANGWKPSEVEGLLVGMSAPISSDYLDRIAVRAGVPASALMVSIHKACDSSMGALHLALNPRLGTPGLINVAEELRGKKVIVGGIEGLSRFTSHTKDKNALQLFGNGMGMIGIIPGETMKFITGKSYETFDEEGLLQVKMYYPHSHNGLLDISQEDSSHLRVAGLMHEPADGSNIIMAGLMGMVKLFVRTGVQVVTEVMKDYHYLMDKTGRESKTIDMGIVHHANYKINALKAKQLLKEGVEYPMPWLLKDFGNVSAASNMIAFLRQLNNIMPGDHVMFDGFGAGTYYDVIAVSFG